MIVDLAVSSFWTALLVAGWFYLFRVASAKWGGYFPGLSHGILAGT